MKVKRQNLVAETQREVDWRSAGLLVIFALLMCVLALSSVWPGVAKSAAADTIPGTATHAPIIEEGGGPDSGAPGAGPGSTVLPDNSVNGPAGWEVSALRDLAEVRDWPPFVSRESSGRLTVQQGESSTEAALALIRPFDFRPGASAAFMAEQEDARLSGFRVSSDTYHTYPAYWAVQYDIDGAPIEMRLHWLANTWIMGVEVQRTDVRTADVRAISEQLLTLAIQ